MAVKETIRFNDYTQAERDLEQDQDAYKKMWFWGFFATIYVIFFVLAAIKKDIKTGFGRKFGRVFLILSFVLLPFAMIGLSLYTILVSKEENALLAHEVL